MEISIPFSIITASFYIPTNCLQGFQFLHILTNTWVLGLLLWQYPILTGVRCSLTVVLIHSFLMIRNGEHHFTYLLAISMFLWRNFYLIPFAHFVTRLSGFFWLLICRNSLYILHSRCIRCMVHIFSYSIGGFSTLLTVPFAVQKHFSVR